MLLDQGYNHSGVLRVFSKALTAKTSCVQAPTTYTQENTPRVSSTQENKFKIPAQEWQVKNLKKASQLSKLVEPLYLLYPSGWVYWEVNT